MLLIDKFRPGPNSSRAPHTHKDIMEVKYDGRKYQFSDDVVVMIGEMIRDHPEILLQNYQFAIPPYEKCYLEFDLRLFLTTLGPHHTPPMPLSNLLGYVINNKRVHILLSYQNNSVPSPLVYNLGSETIPEHLRVICETEDIDNTPKEFTARYDEHGNYYPPPIHVREAELGKILGTTADNPKAQKYLTEDVAAHLVEHYHFCIEDDLLDETTGLKDEVIQNAITESIGDIRNILALLLWLNQEKVCELSHQKASRKMVGNKSVAMTAYHIVRPRVKNVRSAVAAFRAAERNRARRHEVSANWRNYNKTVCDHDWPLYPDIEGHWHCKKCKQWRTRVREHMRGDASIGYVAKDYMVK